MFYLIKEMLQKCGLYLQGGLYLEVAFITGMTVQASDEIIKVHSQRFKSQIDSLLNDNGISIELYILTNGAHSSIKTLLFTICVGFC